MEKKVKQNAAVCSSSRLVCIAIVDSSLYTLRFNTVYSKPFLYSHVFCHNSQRKRYCIVYVAYVLIFTGSAHLRVICCLKKRLRAYTTLVIFILSSYELLFWYTIALCIDHIETFYILSWLTFFDMIFNQALGLAHV